MQEMWEMLICSLDQEEPLEEEMATHSSILAWEIPWTVETGGLQSMGLQRIGHNWAIEYVHTPKLYTLFLLENIFEISHD